MHNGVAYSILQNNREDSAWVGLSGLGNSFVIQHCCWLCSAGLDTAGTVFFNFTSALWQRHSGLQLKPSATRCVVLIKWTHVDSGRSVQQQRCFYLCLCYACWLVSLAIIPWSTIGKSTSGTFVKLAWRSAFLPSTAASSVGVLGH